MTIAISMSSNRYRTSSGDAGPSAPKLTSVSPVFIYEYNNVILYFPLIFSNMINGAILVRKI